MKIINVFNSFKEIGGAESIAYSIHKNLDQEQQNILMSFNSYKDIHKKYNVARENYFRFNLKNILLNRNYIFISHHRKMTTLLVLLDRLFYLKMRIIHVAHNEFNTLKLFSLFPKEIIAVSEKVKENHSSYFGIPKTQITTIYNGIADSPKSEIKPLDGGEIRILYAARINSVKRQLEIVKNISGKISSKIQIYFAGKGEDSEALKEICAQNKNFHFLGFIDITKDISSFDYVMLFSQKEGLPLVLIEALKFGKPIIANTVGGNSEIVENQKNGFLISNFTELEKALNSLVEIEPRVYEDMSIKARQIFESKFSLEKMISNYSFYLNRKK